jgi:hypothetical protein
MSPRLSAICISEELSLFRPGRNFLHSQKKLTRTNVFAIFWVKKIQNKEIVFKVLVTFLKRCYFETESSEMPKQWLCIFVLCQPSLQFRLRLLDIFKSNSKHKLYLTDCAWHLSLQFGCRTENKHYFNFTQTKLSSRQCLCNLLWDKGAI